MQRIELHRVCCSALALTLWFSAGATSTARAATVTWTGDADNGLWFDAANWTGGSGVPGLADEAHFDSSATGTVSLGGSNAQVGSVTLQAADGLVFTNGSLNTASFSQTGGLNTLRIDLATTAINLGSAAQLRVESAATVSAETLAILGLPNQARLSVLSGSTLSAQTLSFVGARVDVDGAGSELRFLTGEVQAVGEVFLTSGGVLGCIGVSATLDALAGSLVNIQLGNAGAPGRIDCATFTLNQGVNASARVSLFHNQDGYRLERPSGEPVSLGGSMGLSTQNAVRTVLPGVHAYSGATTVGNGATLELVGELTGSAVSVQTGAVLSGGGRVHGNVTIAANALIAPGVDDDTLPGTLRVGSLNLVDLSTLAFDLAEPGTVGDPNDLLQVDGAAVVDGGRVVIASLAGSGRYRVVEVGGTVTGSFVLQSVPAGNELSDWQLVNTAGQIDLVPPATLVIDPPTLALTALEGEQVEDTVTLSNVGSSDINITLLVPPEDPRFTRQGGTCGDTPIVIAPAASCTLVYRFAPTGAGAYSSTVVIGTFPQAAGADSIELTGTGTSLSPSDAGVDAGPDVDAGPEVDAGSGDAAVGPGVDAGGGDAGSDPPRGGGGCSTTNRAASGSLELLLLALGAVALRRRRARGRAAVAESVRAGQVDGPRRRLTELPLEVQHVSTEREG